MLYHRELGFPDTLIIHKSYSRLLNYSLHAIKSAKEDRYEIINLPNLVTFSKDNIIEIETVDNIKADKVLIRIPYSEDFDLCVVILLENSLVKTVWLNSVNDKHITLVREKYTKLVV